MRVSVKGRYALAAMAALAREGAGGGNVAVNRIAGNLGISKIYLEQVFAQLKREGLVLSVKGPRGGYQLSREPDRITVWEVLAALEPAFVEPAESTVAENAPDIETAMQTLVFRPLDSSLRRFLSAITLSQLADAAEQHRAAHAFMVNM